MPPEIAIAVLAIIGGVVLGVTLSLVLWAIIRTCGLLGNE
jgi:hypothetical protein